MSDLYIDISDKGFHTIADELALIGEEARIVGGNVRDHLLGLDPQDVDVATSAPPEVVVAHFEKAGFKVVPTGLSHGTVTVLVDGTPYEVTTLRQDVETDGRHAKVRFVKDWQADAERRDFTMNAMSADATGRVHDYFGGYDDLMSGVVRFVGDPDRRIREDYLRIMRYFRFMARFGSTPDEKHHRAVHRNVEGLRNISVERIWSEFSKIIAHPDGYAQVVHMDALEVLRAIRFDVDSRYLSGLRQMRRHSDRPGVLLGSLCIGEHHADEMARLWRLSSDEAEDAVVTARVLADFTEDPDYWLSKAVDMARPEKMVPALRMNRLRAAADRIELGVPVFPVQGRDLIALGMKPGPDLGARLAGLKDEWKRSGFSLGKDELLEAGLSPVRR